MFEWNKSLELGTPGVDDQHMMLMQLTDELYSAVAAGKGRESVGEMIEYLSEYTQVHFRDEEMILVKYKYPDYAEHKRIHDGYRETVRSFQYDFDHNGTSIGLVSKVVAELGNWMITHIGKDDRKVADYMRSIRAI